MHLFRKLIWGYIWKHTLVKNETNPHKYWVFVYLTFLYLVNTQKPGKPFLHPWASFLPESWHMYFIILYFMCCILYICILYFCTAFLYFVFPYSMLHRSGEGGKPTLHAWPSFLPESWPSVRKLGNNLRQIKRQVKNVTKMPKLNSASWTINQRGFERIKRKLKISIWKHHASITVHFID